MPGARYVWDEVNAKTVIYCIISGYNCYVSLFSWVLGKS